MFPNLVRRNREGNWLGAVVLLAKTRKGEREKEDWEIEYDPKIQTEIHRRIIVLKQKQGNTLTRCQFTRSRRQLVPHHSEQPESPPRFFGRRPLDLLRP